jgi:hypothetical protein
MSRKHWYMDIHGRVHVQRCTLGGRRVVEVQELEFRGFLHRKLLGLRGAMMVS